MKRHTVRLALAGGIPLVWCSSQCGEEPKEYPQQDADAMHEETVNEAMRGEGGQAAH